MSTPTVEQVNAALARVNDPEIKRPITELGMVDTVEVSGSGQVSVTVLLTVAGCPLKDTINRDVTAAVSEVPGVTGVDLTLGVMTPEQRDVFNQMQAVMCMVEGYSNHVMNVVGRDLLPKYDAISKTFERRRQDRTQIERLFARLTGLDLKYEQYRLGEEFIDGIAAERGHDVAKRIWGNPASLPTMEEIRQPALWLARVVDARSPLAGS